MQRNNKLRVAFQGELGAFSHAAALKFAGEDARLLPCSTFEEVFEALQNSDAQHAVIPIENTLHGSVLENYDHLVHYEFRIAGETTLRISHHLLAFGKQRLANVRRVFSHPVALNQCRNFFHRHPEIEPVAFYDTAGSVKMLKETRPEDCAAIASAIAAELYGAVILKKNVEDNPHNFTRFFLLTKQNSARRSLKGASKTSIVFSTANTPGALFRAMACFALRDLDLTKIESRPLRERPWEYLFYVDFKGSEADRNVQKALDNLREMATFLKVLGSYAAIP